MQTVEDLVRELDKFFTLRDAEHAKHNFQEIVDAFCTEISPQEFHTFLNEMMKIRMLLSNENRDMQAGAILSFCLNVQLRPIIHKILSFPKAHFETD